MLNNFHFAIFADINDNIVKLKSFQELFEKLFLIKFEMGYHKKKDFNHKTKFR